jgi:glycerate-2-kinase
LEEETPKNISKRHFVEITAYNKTYVNAGINKAKTMGFNTMLLTTYLEGKAKEVVHALSSIVKEIKNSSNPVDIPGQLLLVERQLLRLQEMALAGEIKSSLCHLLSMCRVYQVFLWQTYATNGRDGPTYAAGTFATGATFARAWSLGIGPMLFLLNNDSYHFFDELRDLIKVLPTNTNVNDVIVILIE